MKELLFFVLLIFSANNLVAQDDNVGSGRALLLDGVNDYIELGNRYDNIQFPITISAWINLAASVNDWSPIFVSQDNAPVYNGFWLIVQSNLVGIGYGDGLGENLPQFRRSKTAVINNISERWVHITGIIRGKLDMDLYVNGINVGGTYSGNSDLPMSSSSTDVARIGKWYSNAATFHFSGRIDEVRLWERSLTQNEIRELMCTKVPGSETGLVGKWSFDELTGANVIDYSVSGFNGTLIGGQRVYSGAPLGDESTYIYSNQWSQKHLSLKFATDSVSVSNISGSPYGIHIYAINSEPSQKQGIVGCYMPSYFGVFIDSDLISDQFDLNYYVKLPGVQTLALYSRTRNDMIPWINLIGDNSISNSFKLTNQVYRYEYIRSGSQKVELGNDVNLCDQSEFSLVAGVDDPTTTYVWSTGATSSSIVVNESDKYWVEIQNLCGISKDSIQVNFITSPPPFNLEPESSNLCIEGEIILKPYEDAKNFLLTWNDGSHGSTLVVHNPGTYSVSVENICGAVNGSVTIEKVELDSIFIPNVFTPNGDDWNENFEIDPRINDGLVLFIYNRWGKQVFHSSNYKNNWNGGNLPSGIYYYYLEGECVGKMKGSLSILR